MAEIIQVYGLNEYEYMKHMVWAVGHCEEPRPLRSKLHETAQLSR